MAHGQVAWAPPLPSAPDPYSAGYRGQEFHAPGFEQPMQAPYAHGGSPQQSSKQLSRGPGPMPQLLSGHGYENSGAMQQYPQQYGGAQQYQPQQYPQQQYVQQGRPNPLQPLYDSQAPTWQQQSGHGPHSPTALAATAAMPAAGRPNGGGGSNAADMPRMGRGVYGGQALGHLSGGEAGLVPQEGAAEAKAAVSPSMSRQRSMDPSQGGPVAGVASGSSRGAGFDGYYGRAHAGKSAASSFSVQDGGLGGGVPYTPTPPAAAPAPWDGPAAAAAPTGVRTFYGAAGHADHLSNSEAGITAPEAVQRGRARGGRGGEEAAGEGGGGGGGGFGQGGNGGGAGGLTFGAGDREGYLASRHLGAHAGSKSQSSIRQTEMGLVQEGQTMQRPHMHAGRSQVSQLHFGDGGMCGKPQEAAAGMPGAHAGKITASSLMYGDNGISGSATHLARAPSKGGQYATTYDDTYYKAGSQSGQQARQGGYPLQPNRY